jgi:hypothetical protein
MGRSQLAGPERHAQLRALLIAVGCVVQAASASADSLPVIALQYSADTGANIVGASQYAARQDYVNDVVNASPVDIDLNGHSIDGGGVCSGTPVTSCSGAKGLSGIDASIDINTPLILHVHNGSVHGFASHGVLLVAAGEGSLIEHVSAYENADNGISVSGTSAGATTTRIRDSQLSRNKFSGVQGVTDPAILVVENSTLTGNGGWGIYVNSSSVATGNRINNNGDVGLFCTALTCVLGQNVFIGNNSAGTQFSIGTLSDMGGNVCPDHGSSSCP